MPDAPKKSDVIPHVSSDSAPVIYFDIAPVWGVLHGSVQIELAMRRLTHGSNADTIVEWLSTGHIRCSPAAAVSLREAIDKALAMLQHPEQSSSGAANATLQ
ncbi:MAG: hypothetical protein BroJett030_11470 [Alphaproteobacteria bacterium]|nr:MAG: hypothetical protein BroJett030_11470 [Alphaproteobacteria bacterium]